MSSSFKQIAFILICWLASVSTFAQIPVGEWRDHLPYKNGKVVAETDTRVYCATEMALFYYDKSDGYIQKHSKINMLSDLEPGYIAYSETYNKLIIGYLNGNIDIIIDDKKYNYPDIKIKNIIADKSIKHIQIQDEFAYISTGFGIVVFNLEKDEFADTYIIGPGGSYLNINNTAIYNNYLYALTDNGVLRGDLDDPFLGNYQNWNKVDSLLNPDAKYYSSTVFNEQLLLVNNINDSDSCHLVSFQNEQWDTIFTNIAGINTISSNGNNLIIPSKEAVTVFNTHFEVEQQNNYGYCNHALLNNDGDLWIASPYSTLIHSLDGEYKKSIRPEGPDSKNTFKVFYNNGVMQIAPGGFKGDGAGTYYTADVYYFSDENWSSLRENAENKEAIDSTLKNNVISFTSQNLSSEYIGATYYNGLFEVKNNKITNLFNRETTNGILGDSIGGLTYDKNGNLYIVSNYNLKPFVVRTPDNKWYSYELHPQWKDLYVNSSVKLINTNNNDNWTISSRGKGIMVWNDNDQPEVETNNYKKFDLSDELNVIISKTLNDIVEDHEGVIWIATANGIAVYDYPQNALRAGSDFYARVPQIEIDGYLYGLLEGETATCIAVDGANRKWLGTDGGGLFLVSADGTEQIMTWNTNNSKLFSNTIYSIDINHKTGEVFIGTDKGLQSYKSTSSESKSSYSDIYAFPNPVKGDYNGLITIRGLMYETNVKITDISGNKVYETLSNGGDAIWNGKDLSGNAVAPGVYLVMCSLPDGSQSEATKILIIK